VTGSNDREHHWSKALDDGALFVEYAKAFDHVDHSTVLRKLSSYTESRNL